MVRSRFVLILLTLLLAPAVADAQSSTRPQAQSAAQSQVTPTGGPVLLDFTIAGCQPCRQMEPAIARLQQEGFAVRKVDGSREPAVAQRYNVELYPTFVLLVEGREVWRASGLVGHDVLRTSLVNAARMTQPSRAAVVPAGYDAPAPAANASFQVGSDLGPSQPAGQGPTPDQLLSASVRLRVEDPQGKAFGTGTIIDTRQGEALVLTCGHLFRGQNAQDMISVELFEATGGQPRVVDRAPGQVIAVDLENDVALVTLRPNRPVQAARVASSLGAVTPGAPVWSVGCDLGADPTVRTSRVLGVNRTHRPPNVTSTGAPVQGRSGGGLFNAAGEVVGVCFGADEKVDEGLYADLVSIHAQLDKVGLTAIYRGEPTAPVTLASTNQPANQTAGAPVNPPATPPAPAVAADMTPVAPPPIIRAQNAPPAAAPGFDLASLGANERAALEEISQRAGDSEVICIVRPKQPGGRSEVISLDSVSPAFLQALRAMPSTPR